MARIAVELTQMERKMASVNINGRTGLHMKAIGSIIN